MRYNLVENQSQSMVQNENQRVLLNLVKENKRSGQTIRNTAYKNTFQLNTINHIVDGSRASTEPQIPVDTDIKAIIKNQMLNVSSEFIRVANTKTIVLNYSVNWTGESLSAPVNPPDADFYVNVYYTFGHLNNNFDYENTVLGTAGAYLFYPFYNWYVGQLQYNLANNYFYFVPFSRSVDWTNTQSHTYTTLGTGVRIPNFLTNPEMITPSQKDGLLSGEYKSLSAFICISTTGIVLTAANQLFLDELIAEQVLNFTTSNSLEFYGVLASF